MESSPIHIDTPILEETTFLDVADPANGYHISSHDSEESEDETNLRAAVETTFFTNGCVQLKITGDGPKPEYAPSGEHYEKDGPDEIKKNLSGIGETLAKLRFPSLDNGMPKRRTILDEYGRVLLDRPRKTPKCRIGEVAQTLALSDLQDGFDLPPINVPTDVNVVRRMIRSKMLRCKRCKNRFIERNVYERHLRDRHPADYDEYIAEQEAEMEQQRLEEIEANRIEELQTGGFIPPESEIDADIFDVKPDGIPLPGENNGGVIPRFDKFGRLKSIKRPYKKKISPQCPFCDKRFRNEYSLKKHFNKKHPEMEEFRQCTICFKCLHPAEFKDHECELTFVCFECHPIRNLVTDSRLLNHRKKFHRGANSGFKCSFCSLKFLTPRKLRKHKKMAHVFTKTYQCHFCEELFISEVAVMTHERIHTGIIRFECKVCDFRANRFMQMEDHSRNEHGYVCAICHERESEYSELKHHTLVRHGGYLSSETTIAHIESPRLWMLYKGE